MAASTTLYLPSKVNSAHPSLSFASKVYVGLRAQSPNSFGVKMSNLNVEFSDKVYKSIERCRNGKATRGCITMMPIGTPRVPYRNHAEGTWQWVDMWNALYRERIIYIGDDLKAEFSNQILATMLYLDMVDDSKKLYLYISGPGGDLTPGLAIYDTMKSLKSPIGTHCLSYAYAMAAFILAAGEKGSRSIFPLSSVALEAPDGEAFGQADDIRNEATELVRVRDYLFKELAQNTGQPLEKIYKDLNLVKYFDAEEAVEYGIVDRIARPPRAKPTTLKEVTGDREPEAPKYGEVF
ncbi:ATP-dependent Clp protease, proteolytic subunit [Handroanthus impetiginosus]|uniref:ATP-dependent Clp protease proteolytic subunit n=1 Tax=Handroanthus impetiginosus TaxID=429701 RepID=A0A2G9GJW0_9LAMI|nr:ATP-dependent Clp protease, proteolytic subunit [Handroanthus impetiginosus]